MNFSYSFPAVKGIQAGHQYYISMIPLKLLNKIFNVSEEVVLPQYRAQRCLNEQRIPQIKRYIINNRDSYVFSALAASIDGEYRFVSTNNGEIGCLEIDMEANLLINDGQHRKAALEEALKEDNSLENEHIPVVFFEDHGLEKSQQMFSDLNKHAVKTSNSISTLYESRDGLAIATKRVLIYNHFLEKYTDTEKDNLGKNSSKLFTLYSLYKANYKILRTDNVTEYDQKFLIEFWKCVCNNMVEWSELELRQITKKDLRENYVATLGVTILAIGRLGAWFYTHNDYEVEKYLKKLRQVDWSRSNRDWQNRMIRSDGKIINNEDAIVLTCNYLKKQLDIPLMEIELQKERLIIKRRR